jgi:two-component system, cell cycle sensor histidine kinase and response regulator CckA
MALRNIISQTSRLLAALIGLALAGYIGYLVLIQYRTQLVLQDNALKQLTSDSAKRATAVSYFFSERKDDLRDLAQSREISAYFENQALGMSMEYGLRASLIMIEDRCSKMSGSKMLAGAPIFERIIFVDASGTLLADTLKGGGSPGGTSWRRQLTPLAQGPIITALRHNGELRIQVSAPVHFKGRFAGQVLAWISSAQVYQYFIEGSGEMNRYPVALVFENNYLNLPAKLKGMVDKQSIPPDIAPFTPYKLHPAPGGTDPGGYAILVPVAGTPLSLMTFIPGAEMFDTHAPRRILYTTGGIAVFILAGMFYLQRINTRNMVLQVHLKETTLREAAVDDKNRLLAAEIEERRQTEAALRESEARFRAIVSAVPVVIYEFRQSTQGRSFSFVGEKIEELAGITAEAMLADADAFFDLIHREDHAATLAASDLAAHTGRRLGVEFRIVKPSGETRWILANSLPQQAGQGSDSVWCGCLEDITDRKQADLALRESQQQLLDIIAFFPDPTLVVGRDGRVLAWNRAMELMTGVKAQDMIGRGNYEYALPFYGERRPILIDIALNPDREGKEGYLAVQQEADVIYGESFTKSFSLSNRQNSYLAARASVLRDSKGEVTAAIECIRDSTERLQAEQLLRESEATLRTLMESMPAGVWWFNEAGEVEYLNARFVELFGYTLEELPGVEDWYRHAYPDPEQRAARLQARNALIAEARLSGAPVPPQETMVTGRDGCLRHIIVNTQFSKGRTLEIFTDITEQEFIHNELLKVQKMESLGVLAGGIAHDFNNILTGIMGNISFAQLILKTEEARQPLQAAEKASQRAAELAHQLLTFAKGGQPIKKVVSVRHLVGEAISLSLRGTNVQGKIELPAELHDIEADAGQINQAFSNIAINAVHAMRGGGTLTVSGDNVVLESGSRLPLPPGPYVRLVFRDVGCGIHQADLKNIFDPYFTTKSGGNGLGLASTLSIVRKHGGHVLVHSEVGVGTSFTFYLPATSEAPPSCETSSAGVLESRPGGKVLVMDDEEMLRTLSTKILEHLGYQVTTCVNGEEAIELYARAKEEDAPYFAVIMDLTIPGGMGGKEAAQRILAYDPDAKLVVSSGYSNDLALSDYGNYGFCGAVVKPYKVAELADTLEALKSS